MLIRITFIIAALFFTTHTIADQRASDEIYNKRQLTLLTQTALTDENLLREVVKILSNSKKAHTFTTVIDKLQQNKTLAFSNQETLSQLKILSTNACVSQPYLAPLKKSCAANKTGTIEVPELWLYLPKTAKRALIDTSAILFAYPPSGDEATWAQIEAFDRYGNIVYLDPTLEPQVPVIVIETKGTHAFEEKVRLMNESLQNSGLQTPLNDSALLESFKFSIQATEMTSKMTKIRLNDDEEPWVKGSAEIYMVTSGVKSTGSEAEIKITPLHYLDEDEKNYYPNQLVLFWNNYAYNAANLQLWEDDGDTNYQALLKALIQAIGRAGGLFELPELTIVTEIAAIIIDAIPENWYTDDDDFVDTCYTIERNKNYYDHYCAAGNARVSVEPFILTN